MSAGGLWESEWSLVSRSPRSYLHLPFCLVGTVALKELGRKLEVAHSAEPQLHIVLGEGFPEHSCGVHPVGKIDPKASVCVLGSPTWEGVHDGSTDLQLSQDTALSSRAGATTGFCFVRLTCFVKPPLYQEV